MRRNNESGQALVLVLLSLAVVLTLVLFVLSRSITDVAVSSSQEESVRAFSAAEAGVEVALLNTVIGSSYQNSLKNNSSYNSVITSFSADNPSDFAFPSPLLSGETMTTWFVGHDSSGNLICDSGAAGTTCFKGSSMRVCWGNPDVTSADPSTWPAIEVSIYYEATPGDLATVRIARAAYDPNSSRTAVNSFAAPVTSNCTVAGTTYPFQENITFSNLSIPSGSYNSENGLQFARIRMFYNTTTGQAVGVTVAGTGANLPSQGESIVSTGTAGGSNRKINVYQGWPESPFGGNAVVSPLGITK
jgi:Tfp pilus assembly protein PilX